MCTREKYFSKPTLENFSLKRTRIPIIKKIFSSSTFANKHCVVLKDKKNYSHSLLLPV